SPTLPSSSRRLASRSAAAVRTAAASARPRRTRSRSVLCAIVSPQSLTATGEPISCAAAAAAAAAATSRPRAIGTWYLASSSFEACSESVRAVVMAGQGGMGRLPRQAAAGLPMGRGRGSNAHVRRFVFLDRDGTINHDPGYVYALLAGVVDAL